MNLNKDYLLTVDIKQATVSVPSNMSFYITDIKTANIFAQLVINESSSDLIKKYAPVENAQDFEITLRLIKPNNEFKELKFTLLNQLEAFFMVDLTDEFKDYIGTYNCELFVDCVVNGELERVTTSSFNYKVNKSIVNDLDDVIEGDPDYPILDELLDRLEAMNPDYYATNASVNIRLSGKADKDHAHDEYATNEALSNAALKSEVPSMIESYLTAYRDSIALSAPFKMIVKTNVPLDARTVVDTESDIMNIEYPYVGMIVYVRDTGKRYEILTLAPKQVGLGTIQDACVGTYRELDYATTAYVDEAVANAGGNVNLDGVLTTDDIVIIGGGEETYILTPDNVEADIYQTYLLKNVQVGDRYYTNNLVLLESWMSDEDKKWLCITEQYGFAEFEENDGNFVEIYADDFMYNSDLKNYATTTYVDDKIGDIEAALSAILGGEDNGGWPTGGGAA